MIARWMTWQEFPLERKLYFTIASKLASKFDETHHMIRLDINVINDDKMSKLQCRVHTIENKSRFLLDDPRKQQ